MCSENPVWGVSAYMTTGSKGRPLVVAVARILTRTTEQSVPVSLPPVADTACLARAQLRCGAGTARASSVAEEVL